MKLELLGGMFDGKVVDIPNHVTVLEVPHAVHLPDGTFNGRTPFPEQVFSRYIVLLGGYRAKFEGEFRK